ncbi:MAG: sigma-70 family RNA polymerase sigma factor [Kofleriaceae bacterium]|nr:sigma-70 family RNA polymerase sigma factor [Kofleriaceae bacterium]
MEDVEQDRLAQLSAEMAWLRRLARALLKTGDADDLAHDTWLAANAHPPDDARPLKPWLTRVALNVVRMQARAKKRQDARDHESASLATPVATPEQIVERVELQRVVAGEVLALAEPYRSTVLLHYFEELSCAEIARRIGVPEATVRGRLKVALDQLRTRLGRGDRGSRARLAALTPLAAMHGPPRTAAIAVGAFAMKKLALAILLVLVIVGVFLWRQRGDSRSDAGARAEPAGARSAPRVGPERAVAVPAWMTARHLASRRIAGRVELDGNVVHGATVRLALQARDGVLLPVAERASDASGHFDFGPQPAATFVVSADAPNQGSAVRTISVADPAARPEELVLLLTGCTLRMYGVVRDAASNPIAKARITSGGLGGTDTDEQGRYTLCLPQTQPNIRIEADGYGTIESILRINGALRSDFVLVPEGIIIGQVVTRERRPVPGARILATPDPIEMAQHLATGWALADDGGMFRLAGLAPGRYRLRAAGDGVACAAQVEAIVHAGTTAFNTILIVDSAATVRGHVVMAGKPVAGARVAATSNDEWVADAVYSQADGSFELTSVPFGSVALEAWPHRVASPARLNVDRATIENVTVEVAQLATIRGTITRHGEPVAGASVFAPRLATAIADSHGVYALEGLPAGEIHFFAGHAGDKAFADKVVTVREGEDKTVDVELDLAGEASGVVVDERGNPVSGVYVLMTSNDRDTGESMTDDAGRFDCITMAGGEYAVEVLAGPGVGRPFAPANGEKFPSIQVPSDGAVTGIRLAIANDRVHIRGVVMKSGAPVSDAYVEITTRLASLARTGGVMTDTEGRFELENLAPGKYSLHAHTADGSDRIVWGIEGGADDVVIELEAPGSIEGDLAGFASTPIVEIATLSTGVRVTTAALVDGTRFRQRGLPPGRYGVQARAGGEVASAEVEVRAGETEHVTLRPSGIGTIVGTVRELETKRPLAGFTCEAKGSLAGPAADPTMSGVSDETGRFTMRSPTGLVHVICRPNDNGLSIAGADVEVVANGTATVVASSVRSKFTTVRGNAGLVFQSLTLPLTIGKLDPEGPAAAQGAKVGDHVVAIDGMPLDGVLPLGAQWLVLNHRPGTTLTLAVERAGAPMTFQIPVEK